MNSSSEQITREILDNVPAWLSTTFYVAAFVAIAWAALGFYQRSVTRRRKSRDGVREGHATKKSVVAKFRSALGYMTFHQQLLRDRDAGIAHLLMFYGFFILFIGTCLVFLEHDTPLHFFYGWFYLIASLIVDLGGVAFLIGIGMFLWRRHRRASDRLLHTWWVAAMGWLLAAIGVTGFVLEGARIARDFPPFERWSIVGYTIALGLDGVGLSGPSAASVHRVCWGVHAALCVVFFALLPWRFFAHAVYGLMSWVNRRRQPLSQLAPVALTSTHPPGASTAREFSYLDLLQADACTTCGRCNEVCPANAAGKPLRPREIVLGLRAASDADAEQQLTSWIADESLWSCTTCSACNSVCPVGIDIYDKIVDLRRGRTESGIVPHAAESVFESVATRFNCFNKSSDDRMLWAHDLHVPVASSDEPIELLYWIGCAGSFDPDGRAISRAMIKILNHARINYRVLGCAERCTGDPVRRMGEEGLFQELAAHNRDLFRQHQVRRILTHCPHCFNTIQNEYPTLRSEGETEHQSYEVIHHSQFLDEMLSSGKVSLDLTSGESITFHDPCYLARGNGVVESPRNVLSSLPGATLTEMPRHGQSSFCCGAGGGAMWLDVRGDDRAENIRFREAQTTGAKTLVTGCPFCKTMLEASRQASVGEESANPITRVKDLAELMVESMRL